MINYKTTYISCHSQWEKTHGHLVSTVCGIYISVIIQQLNYNKIGKGELLRWYYHVHEETLQSSHQQPQAQSANQAHNQKRQTIHSPMHRHYLQHCYPNRFIFSTTCLLILMENVYLLDICFFQDDFQNNRPPDVFQILNHCALSNLKRKHRMK